MIVIQYTSCDAVLLKELNLSVNHGWLAVDANHHQGVDAGVKIDDDDGVDNFAQSISIWPVKLVEDVHCPEREATQKNKVSQRQVAQIDLCYGQSILVGYKHSQDKTVKKKPQQRYGEDIWGNDGQGHGPFCGIWRC
uniref:Uncharacterized protein n=1 Tax=Amphiprion ocellaris TaxID=80972 RepID=A0A3Q1BYQ5_AMPOC